MKKHPLIGCCGISCGLCPRFQSRAPSRCSGCGPDAHCSYCPVFRCCSLKRNYETCADCPEYPCDKIAAWSDGDSFVSHRNCLLNLDTIKKAGTDAFLKGEAERREILETMLENYNPGRCTSLYCLASTLMSIGSLRKALARMGDIRTDKPKSFKILIQEMADKEKIPLKLRR